MNFGPKKGRILSDLVLRYGTRVMLELGGCVGYTAILLGIATRKAFAESEDGTKGKEGLQVWSLEFDAENAQIARDMVSLAGMEGIVTVVDGDTAAQLMRKLLSEGKLKKAGVDMLLMDHKEDLYEADFRVAWEELGLLRSGSIVVADNMLVTGAPEYERFLRETKGLKSERVEAMIVPGDIEVS